MTAKQTGKFRKYILNWLEIAAISIAVAFLLRVFVVQSIQIDDGTMYPTLQPKVQNEHVADLVLVNKVVFGAPIFKTKMPGLRKKVHHGEIVMMRVPNNPEKFMIARVVATPGQIVQIINYHVYIDGLLQNEYYLEKGETQYFRNSARLPGEVSARATSGRYQLKDGQYFVLGDNRTGARDSRVFGVVDRENIVGKVFFIYSPLTRFAPVN